jgi:phosphatidylethanolamine/phosphatidyl-N-methylethanolamine N-methyltransferase
LIFRLVLKPGRKAAAQAVNRFTGKRVLDIGVGTGLELPMFDSSVKVTGIDLSTPMLAIARERVAKLGLTNVEGLRSMDATNLEFGDGSFDAVVSPYVLTVIPQPERMLDEAARVIKPGGEIILVNHIAASAGPIATMESWLSKHQDKLGWDPMFRWSVVSQWLDKHPEFELVERRTLHPLGLFTLARLKKNATA